MGQTESPPASCLYSHPHDSTLDAGKREGIAREAMTVAMQDHAVIPLHHQMTSWAMRKALAYTARTDELTLAYQFRSQ